MVTSSHRLRIEEKKVYRKLLITLVLFVLFILVIIFAGIPVLTKSIIFLTSFKKENTITNTNSVFKLEIPILNPLTDATNSSPISLSGFGEKETTIKILVNDNEAVKILSDKDGKFEAKNIKLTEGQNNIVAVTLKYDQESSPSSPQIIIYQKNPPKLDISTPNEGQKFLAESKEITISGVTDPGNKVTINERLVIVSQDGKFNYKVTLSDGDNNYKVVATDIAGNQTTIERKVNFTP